MAATLKHAFDKFYAFMDKPISYGARLGLLIACVPLALSPFHALWRISMEAPQYPNGLWVEIFAHKLASGNSDQHLSEINALNHYIGMHAIDVHDLSELGWIPFVIGLLWILTLRVAAIGNIRALIDLAVVVFYALGFMAARFVYRLYGYGHDLAPNAPFKVEPFTPAILGTKQIANFTTHGWPQLGSVLLCAYALCIAVITLWQLIAGRRAAMASASWPAPAASPS